MSSGKNILWLLLLLLLAAGFLFWHVWLYQGIFIINSNTAPTQITITSEKQVKGTRYTCVDISCSYQLSPGMYEIIVAADGYFQEKISQEVTWKRDTEITVELQKVPSLQLQEGAPEGWQEDDISSAFTIDENGVLEYADPETQTVTFVSEFSSISNEDIPSWQLTTISPEKLFVLTSTELYQVDVSQKRKWKILETEVEGIFKNIRVFEEDILLLQSTIDTFFFFPETRQKVFSSSTISNTDLVCQNPEENTEFFVLSPQNQNWQMQLINLNNKTTQVIDDELSFPTPPEQIQCLQSNTIAIKHAKTFSLFSF